MTTTERRLMCFALRRLRPLGDSGGKSRWRWMIYSYPDLAFLQDGQIIGDLETADRMARVAITTLGGTVDTLRRA